MKKLIPILIVCALLLSFTACSDKVPELSQETFFFENTTWGMTKAETMKALKLKDSDFKVKDEQKRESQVSYVIDDYKYKGLVCDLTISFTNGLALSRKADCLASVIVNYDDIEAVTKEWQAINDEMSGNDSISSYKIRWDSIMTVKDYAINNEIPFEDIVFFDKDKNYNKDQFDHDELGEKLNEKPVAYIAVDISTSSSATGYAGSIVFNGGVYAFAESFKK